MNIESNNIILIWDIENVNYRFLEKLFKRVKLSDIEKKVKNLILQSDKHFVRNDKNSPIKENKENFLINNDWSQHLVKPGKDSADFKIKDLFYQKESKYDTFILISNDSGFSDLIINLSNKGKKVILVSQKDRNNKLMRKCYKNKEFDTKKFKQYLI